jgi:hypothetical protein
MAALGGLTAVVALLAGLPSAKADEAADWRANQEPIQARVDQLAQGGNPGAGTYLAPTTGGATTVQMMGGSFPRSILIPGTDTSLRVGGEIREIFDYFVTGGNPNATPQSTTIGDNGQLLAIPLAGNARARSHSIFLQSPRESKFNVESRTPTAWGEARTVFEFDWAGSTGFAPGGANPTSVSDNLVPRLRYAYGTLGGVLAGQATSNFSDPDANAETIDFGGNMGEPGVVRIPQVRYTMPLGGWRLPGALSFSAETPETDGWTLGGSIASDGSPISLTPGFVTAAPTTSVCTNAACTTHATVLTGVTTGAFFDPFKAPSPDLTAAWYIPQPWGHMDFSTVVRPALQIKDGFGVDRTYTGFGLHIGGDVKPGWFGWAQDDINFQFVSGEGIGRFNNCTCSLSLVTNYPAVASAAAAATFRASVVNSWGGELGYKHFWAPNLRSTLSGGILHQELNSSLLNAAGAGSLNKELINAHLNLIWSPVSFVDVGIEYTWGRRQVVTNVTGDLNVLISKFSVKF